MRELLPEIGIDELIECHQQDVTPRFVRLLRQAGHTGNDIEEIIEMRARGLEADDE
jgi:hypothetical protein